MAKLKAQTHQHPCHITDLVQVFVSVENGGFNLVLSLANPFTCMTLKYHYINNESRQKSNDRFKNL